MVFCRRKESRSDVTGAIQPKDLGGGWTAGLDSVSLAPARSEVHGTKRLPSDKTLESSKDKVKRKKMTQMFLDVGQRNFFSTQCALCGFVYTPGNREEERLHDAHHRNELHLDALKVKTIPSGATLMSRDEQGAIYKGHYSLEVGSIKAVVVCLCALLAVYDCEFDRLIFHVGSHL